MDFHLTPEQENLRKRVIDFAQSELNVGAIERDREGTFCRELWNKCGEAGVLGLPIPTEYGGWGLDTVSTAIALEALGEGCKDGGLLMSVCAHLCTAMPIFRFGSERQRQLYLPKLCSGELIAAYSLTEPNSGSDAMALSTTAVEAGGGFQINGVKSLIGNAPVADLAIVFAVTDPEGGFLKGVTPFLVERETPGFTAGENTEKMGLRSCPFGDFVLENVDVSHDAVLGRVGGGSRVFSESMNWERVCLFATHVGTMSHLVELTVRRARSRSQFGQAIGKFQAVSHRIADCKVKLEASRLLIQRAAWKIDQKKNVAMDAAIAKLFVSEAYVETARAALQVHGGLGYLTEFEIERHLRDSLSSTIYSGTSEMQRSIIARRLGLE